MREAPTIPLRVALVYILDSLLERWKQDWVLLYFKASTDSFNNHEDRAGSSGEPGLNLVKNLEDINMRS
jgi:hypothetical protein